LIEHKAGGKPSGFVRYFLLRLISIAALSLHHGECIKEEIHEVEGECEHFNCCGWS
jgi:hypothetical protein